MKKVVLKKMLLLLTFILAIPMVFAQNTWTYNKYNHCIDSEIIGASEVEINQPTTYQISSSCRIIIEQDQATEPGEGMDWWISPYVDQEKSENGEFITLTFPQPGTYTLYFDYDETYRFDFSKEIKVNLPPTPVPLTPPNPILLERTCEAPTITRPGTPQDSIQWYWQTSPSGTLTNLGFDSILTIHTSGNYYLRARSTQYGGTAWSTHSSNPISVSIAPCPDFGDKNYVHTTHYQQPYSESELATVPDNEKVETITYFNALGKATQTQTFDVKTERIWARHILYDSQGRPALQTLSAPISDRDKTTPETFQYKEDFIRNKAGAVFTSADFEGSPALEENPKEVQSLATTYDLGRQYSAHNTAEERQDITTRPYTRTLYSTLNPGSVLKIIGGNKIDTNADGMGDAWKQGFSYTFPASQEMYYAFGIDGIEDAGEISDRLLEPTLSRPQNLWENGSLTTLVTDYYYGSLDDVSNERANALNSISGRLAMDFPLLEGVLYYIEDARKFIKAKGKPVYRQFEPGPTLLSTNMLAFQSFNRAQDFLDYESRKQQFEDASAKNHLINWLKATKTIAQDIHGVETVVFADTDGKTLAAARSGGIQQYEVLSLIGKQKYVDIHIPVGCGNTLSFVGASRSDFIIYNLRTEELVSSTNLEAGFYRIQYRIDNDKLDFPALSYIDENSNTIEPVFSENIGVRYQVNYYDYALNYYDRAGRLVKSTQPLGFDSIALEGLKTQDQLTHNLVSTFAYNALGQLIETTSPDEGTTEFLYRKDGQIRFSRNEKQEAAAEFSYTHYDHLGRPVESGVARNQFATENTATGNNAMGFGNFNLVATPIPFAELDPDSTSPIYNTKNEEKQETFYDLADAGNLEAALGEELRSYYTQTFVAGNVSKTNNNQTTTWYSYDIYGRVTWVVQDIEGLGVKTIDYEYDPVTSAVTKVDYQKYNSNERFVHKYNYHAVSGELLSVATSEDGSTFSKQADYTYYETGALKELNIAEGLQRIDYTYNVAGQLKAINNPHDLEFENENDAFGMLIDYYQGDYQRANAFESTLANSQGIDQYNGNIKAVTWSTRKAGATGKDTYYYKYNKNNWLEAASFGNELEENSTIANDDYAVYGLSYDANGNIQTLHRNKNTENNRNAMDQLGYVYKTDKPNQLLRVEDSVAEETHANDIKNQEGNNYLYNNIGQLIENVAEGIKYSYNAVGLVSEIQKNNVTLIKVYYNDKGFRVRKESYDTQGNLAGTQYYVRDVAGTVMAIYEGSTQVELPVFGASRLGVYKKGGTIQYELTDHLGNVRAVIDKGNSVVFTDDLEESAGWNSEGAKYGRSAVFSTERSRSGNTSVKLVNETYNQYKYAHSNTWISIDNDAPADYVYSGWFYSTGPRVRFLFFMNEDSETGYFTEISETDVSTQRNQWVYLENRVTVPSNIDKINFRIDTFGGYYDSAGTVWYDDLKIEKMANSTNTPSLFADYYPGGMTMPNRNVQGDYRYGYQGQFAETDPETGKPAFQLRLYDPRINRWLTTDPYNQYHSPYVGMGNDWVNSIDPDGGYKTWFGALGGWIAGGFQGKINHRGHGGDLEYAVTRSIKNDNWKGGDDPLFTLKNDYGTTKVLNIFRDTQTNLSTTSTFTFGGVNGFILEPAGPDTTTPNLDRRIPEGVYNLEAYSSKKYPSNFRLYNSQVSKTRKILLHKGNYPKNTEGCLLPGCSRTTDAVWTSGGSRGKFTELRNAINAVDVENVMILIHNDFH